MKICHGRVSVCCSLRGGSEGRVSFRLHSLWMFVVVYVDRSYWKYVDSQSEQDEMSTLRGGTRVLLVFP
ncbi:hypothetical protein M3J09_012736 [Ascochyta lentis]